MHRPTVGGIAAALLGLGAVLWIGWPGHEGLRDACWRAGFVLGLLWLALPQLRTLPRWALWAAAAALAAVVLKPRLLFLCVPALIVIWILQPRRTPR